MHDIRIPRNSDITADSTDKLENLRIQLAEAERLQATMRKVTAIIKKERNPARQVWKLMHCFNNDRNLTLRFLKPHHDGSIGYTKEQLAANRADVRNLKNSIVSLEKVMFARDIEEVTHNYIYREDIKENRIMFIFTRKPGELMRAMLQNKGFRLSSTREVWSQQWTDKAVMEARQIKVIMDVTD
ncbi:MAG: hypothetical protein LBC14_00410 [Desulfovibrio sp.]|jgi:hypothetical protein|nr:hypothetical protein [Desulfovibrio sp.]